MVYYIIVVKVHEKYTEFENSKLLGRILWTDYRCARWGSLHWRCKYLNPLG